VYKYRIFIQLTGVSFVVCLFGLDLHLYISIYVHVCEPCEKQLGYSVEAGVQH
jgi:hypothetical protein